MSKIAKYSLNKLIVLWTVLLLFTPCTTKQSLKGFLGIPVTTLYTADQANKLRNCPETRQGSENQAATYASEKQLKDQLLSQPGSFPATYTEPAAERILKRPYSPQAYTVPIYILHEQLLI